MPRRLSKKDRNALREHDTPQRRAYDTRKREAARAYVDAIKLSRGCMDCGSHDLPPYCYEFDHRDPTTKITTIGIMVNSKGSKARLDREIDKCDVVCANCHRIRTHKESKRGRDHNDDTHRGY